MHNDDNKEMSATEKTRAKSLAYQAICEAAMAEHSHDAAVARHHAARAQRFHEELAKLLDGYIADDELEEREQTVGLSVESAFDQVCVLRDVEKKAAEDRKAGQAPTGGTTDSQDYNAYRRSQIGAMGLEQAAGLTPEDWQYAQRQERLDLVREEFLVTTSTMTTDEDEAENAEIDAFTFLLAGPVPTLDQLREYRHHGPGSLNKRQKIESKWRQMEGYCQIAWLDETKPRETPLGLEIATDDLNPAIGAIRVAFRNYQTKEITGYSEPLLCCAEHAERLNSSHPQYVGDDWSWLPPTPGAVTKLEADKEKK